MTRGAAARSRATRGRRTASLAVVALVASGLGYAAVASDGTTLHETDLNDAGVWVSSGTQAKFAKANVPIGQLDTGVATDVPAGSGLDVLQDGATVLGLSTGTGELFGIDARTSTAGDPVTTIAATRAPQGVYAPRPVDLRGGTLAVLDPASGKVYAQRVDPASGTDSFPGVAVGAKPVATIGRNGAVAVGVDGTIHAVSGAAGTVTTVPVTASGFGAPAVVETPLRATTPDITAVGSTWVVYDARSDRLHTADRPEGFDAQVTIDGTRHAALQQPGPDADAVVVASAQRAARVPLDGGLPAGGVVVGEQVNRVPGATLIARPVVLDGCLHAAWAEQNRVFYGANCGRVGDEPTATLPADGAEPTRDGVAFRVNRGLVVLNDLDNGGVWDLDDKPTKIDNWDALVPPTRQDDDNDKKDENLLDEAALQQPPTAVPDSMAVRPGRTSKLHVLDNDTDVAGSVLAIDQRDVSAPSLDGVTATVSADGQAIDVSVPEGARTGAFEFSYKVNNGKAVSKESAKVSVRIVGDEVNGPPRLRQGATIAGEVYPVIAGKRLSVPVLADWRDPESDVLSARAGLEGSVVDGVGRVTLVAPATVGRHPVPYIVTDGRGGTTEGRVNAQVIGTSGESRFVPPRTQPDAVRGVVGKPLQVEPLGNDIAGADPGEPDATLALRSEVRSVGPLQVDTDLATGQVTVTGSAPGTFELSYAAVTGAGAAPGRIRVDLVAPPEGAPPVSVPDTATLHDQAPAMVDVLANDYSPRGDVLVTASVESSGESAWIQPSIYQGRWVRLEARTPAPAGEEGRRGLVRYTVSDGTQRVTGQVAVFQEGPLADALPIVQDDRATVREGDTVSIPVLDNDTMADGIPLRLDPSSVRVVSKGDAQRAFASGNVIRYVPEARALRAEKFVTIEYAAYAEGDKERAQSARVRVQVTPLPDAQRVNQVPVARSFSATVTAGDPLTMTIPTFGVDADGDSVTVVGVVGADGGSVDLTYGRVVGTGPTTIRYEAYPLAAGTEVITYQVRDRFGGTSTAFVRVGVVQPGDPQPPVAVPDEVIAAPGKTVTVRPLVNDLIARGDSVEVDTESLNDKATLRQWRIDEDHTVTTRVPADTTAPHQIVYGISNGLFDPSRASILVRPVAGYRNPPVANDDVAAPKPGETSTLVDALANDTDVDSDPETLKIVGVLSTTAQLDPATGQVRVQILDHAYSVPYVIEDEDGEQAMAVIHVPTGAGGQPFVVAGSLIEMDPDSTRTVPLGDHVRSPRGRVVSVTTAQTLSASPAENLSVAMRDNRTLELTSSGGYVGPAAVMVEVTDQDAVGQRDFGTAYVSIPVQIGPKVPLLRCPDGAVTVTAGGLERVVDIPTFCHAWLPVGMTLDDVEFRTSWEQEPDAELTVDGAGGRRLTLRADPDARTSQGTLRVTSDGLDTPSTIAVRVLGADAAGAAGGDGESPLPPPRVRPISVTGLEEGDTRTVDVRAYLDSPLPQPQCTVTEPRVESGAGLTVSASGCTVTLTVGPTPSPTASVGITVSDGPGRQAQGRIAVTMLGRPSVPRQVSAVADRDAGGQARVSWLPPSYDGGSLVSGYLVRWSGGSSGQSTCSASPCTVTGLTNGQDYRFTVAAVNGVGEGEESAPTAPVRPDRLPEQVTGTRMVSRGDGTLTIAWDEPVNEGSAVRKYVVRLVSSTGQSRTQEVAAPTRQVTVTGLDNMAEQSVQVQAWNELGAGPFGPAVTMQSAGTPAALPAPSIAASGPGPAKDSATLTISWEQGSPNGPPTTRYSLYQSVDAGGWSKVADTAPDDRSESVVIPYDGRTYRYTVTLTNGAGIEGPKTNSSSFTSAGQPSTPTVTARTPESNRRVELLVNVGQPRAGAFATIRWSGAGQSGTYTCGCPPNTVVTIRTTAYDTGGTTQSSAQPWTVATVNSAGNVSEPAQSNSVWPFGATLDPGRPSGNVNGTDIVWRWNNPPNGRRVDEVKLRVDGNERAWQAATERFDQNGVSYGEHTLQVRARVRENGRWYDSGWSPEGRVNVPAPPPEVYNVRKSQQRYIDPGGTGSCSYSPGCYAVVFDYRNFPPNSTWSVRCQSERAGGFTSGSPFNARSGSGTSTDPNVWAGQCLYGNNVGRVTVTLFNGTNSYSGSVFWS